FWSLKNNQPPLTFMILGLIGLIFGNNYTTYRVSSALLGILFGLIILLFFIRKYPKRKFSLIILAVSLTIDWTLLFRFKTGDLNSFVIFIGMICFLGIYFCMEKDTYWSNALVGLFFGLVMNTKWSLVFIILPYIFEFVYSLITGKKKAEEEGIEYKTLAGRRILKAALALGTFLVIFLPYFLTILLNGNFAQTFDFHSQRFGVINFSYLKYYLVYSPFMCVFGLVSVIRLWKKRKQLYQRVLLFSLVSFIWLYIIPSYADFSTFLTFMPFVAFEGMILVIDFITPRSTEQESKDIPNDTKPTSDTIEEPKEGIFEKIKKSSVKLQNKIQTKGPLNKTILVIVVIFLLFPTGYLVFRFYDNSHVPKTAQIDTSVYINNYLESNPLLDNELISVPLTMGLLMNTDQWIDSYEVTMEPSIVEDYLLNNLTLFCLDFVFAEKELAQNSLVFQMALNGTTEIINGTSIHMELLIEFEGYNVYKIIKV
ncbi:MAG: ArnT family glycosyltransferase, partial [Candidatus Heimdallarchaeota archaeon]